MATGTIKYWNSGRGFGFAIPDQGGEDVFVHARSLVGSIDELREGQRVKFEARPSARHAGKFEAVAVSLL